MIWQDMSLAELADVRSGGGAPQNEESFSDNGLPFVRAGSLVKLLSGTPETALEKIKPEVARSHGLKPFPPGTVLFAKSGMSATKGYIYSLRDEAYVVNHLAALIPRKPSDSAFLMHALQRFSPTALIKDPAYPSIRLGDIEEMTIRAPRDSDERERIAAILDQADALRRKRREATYLTNKVIESLFVEKFGRPRQSSPYLKKRQLGEVCNLFAGNSLPEGDEYSGQIDGHLLLKVGDFNLPGNEQIVTTARGWIDETQIKGSSVLAPKDSIVFPKRGGAIATNKKRVLGRSCVLDPNLMAVAPKDELLISYPYLRVWFELLDLSSISNGSTVPQLNKSDLHPLEMAIPDEKAIRLFDAAFHQINELREKHVECLEAMEFLFNSLQHRAFRGEL